MCAIISVEIYKMDCAKLHFVCACGNSLRNKAPLPNTKCIHIQIFSTTVSVNLNINVAKSIVFIKFIYETSWKKNKKRYASSVAEWLFWHNRNVAIFKKWSIHSFIHLLFLSFIIKTKNISIITSFNLCVFCALL